MNLFKIKKSYKLTNHPSSNIQHLISGVLLLVLLISPAYGRGVGTSGNSALRIGVGARATGMGEASVAVADDISSIYWNPAGLFRVRSTQFSAMHIEWLDDIRYEWLAYAQPITSRITLAADVAYIYMGSMPRTIESITEGYEADGTFSPSDIAGRVGFGARIRKDLLLGASVQILRSRVNFENVTKEKITDKIAQSTAISLGCIYNTPVPRLTAGLSLQNVGSQTQAFFEKKEPMPTILRLGVAYRLAGLGAPPLTKAELTSPSDQTAIEVMPDGTVSPETPQPPEPPRPQSSGLILAMDLNYAIDTSLDARFGTEYRFGNGISVRGGYRTGTGFDFPAGLSVGAGYNTASYQLDYALIPYGDMGNTHRVSFTIRF